MPEYWNGCGQEARRELVLVRACSMLADDLSRISADRRWMTRLPFQIGGTNLPQTLDHVYPFQQTPHK